MTFLLQKILLNGKGEHFQPNLLRINPQILLLKLKTRKIVISKNKIIKRR